MPYIPNWTSLTPEPGHYCFGYYDRVAWDETRQYHLALRIPQQERLPEAGESAEVGVVDREGRAFRKLATTTAWCHQQGAMTLWLDHRPGCFVFNDFDHEQDRVIARICHVTDGIAGSYDFPIYAVSPDGRWASSLNFGRIPRRGYSYACAPLPVQAMPDLDEDGLFLIDLETGSSRLIASYRQMMAVHPHPWDLDDQYVWLNHSIFNCDSSRVMVLFRHRDGSEIRSWKTQMMTMNTDGSDLACTLSSTCWNGISHQIWGRTPREILVDANWCGRGSEYVVYDESKWPLQAQRISPGSGLAGHLNFSPDAQWLVADTYAHDGWQQLFLIRVADGDCRCIGRFRHDLPGNDMRCDLHPRWSQDSSLLSVDTIHEGDRKIYMLEVGEALLRFEELEELG